MPTTSGTVSSFDGGNKITATFVVDGVQCTFNGSFDPPVGDFNSYDAKLDYSDIKQLTTQREFRGKVSSQNLIIDTNNGAKITSHSDKPISPVSQFSGRGSWEHSWCEVMGAIFELGCAAVGLHVLGIYKYELRRFGLNLDKRPWINVLMSDCRYNTVFYPWIILYHSKVKGSLAKPTQKFIKKCCDSLNHHRPLLGKPVEIRK